MLVYTFTYGGSMRRNNLRSPPLRGREILLLAGGILLTALCWGSCASPGARASGSRDTAAREARLGTGQVALDRDGEGYRLLVEGKPFYVRGVGLGPGTGYPEGMSEELKKAVDLAARSGANAIRTWSWESAPELLDYCAQKGMMVCVGLWIAHERHGFNYGDPRAVLAQRESFRPVVERLKDHPALLMWGVGNEVETEARNMRVWDAVNDVSRMIHEIDGNHPTMYVTADYFEAVALDIRRRAGDVDVIGVNSYANLPNCLAAWEESGETRPLLVTEWGPSGWWEGPVTPWGAPVEPVSGVRLEQYRDNYQALSAFPGRVLGSFAFYWGEKQERTHTWFSLVLRPGVLTEASDALAYSWTGSWPENRAPHIKAITLDGKAPEAGVRLQPGQTAEIRLDLSDREGDPLATAWVLRRETTASSIGGDAELAPPEVSLTAEASEPDRLVFQAPRESGAYRLFAQAEDGRGKAATANFPFLVE